MEELERMVKHLVKEEILPGDRKEAAHSLWLVVGSAAAHVAGVSGGVACGPGWPCTVPLKHLMPLERRREAQGELSRDAGKVRAGIMEKSFGVDVHDMCVAVSRRCGGSSIIGERGER